VYLINGPVLFFNFFKVGVPYFEFVEWFERVTDAPVSKAA
jgi:hypothetical protein